MLTLNLVVLSTTLQSINHSYEV